MSTTATTPHSAAGAPLADATRLGGVELRVTDLERSLEFYTDVIGLSVHDRDGARAALGTGGEDLVTLHADSRRRTAGHHAGIYHYALLFDSREELARAGARVSATKTPIDGASDHGTHEAIYLPDPDGIGIELAADRPRDRWPDPRSGDMFAHGPQPLDAGSLFATIEGEALRPSAAEGLRMGHMHLHVGDLDAANRFYIGGIGFEQVMALPSAVFVAAGGYHHHLAYNLWRGRGAGTVPDDVVGLRHWTLVTASPAERDAVQARLAALGATVETRDDGLLARDPSGIALLIR
jgi:catechol 2,3-dioxygenase